MWVKNVLEKYSEYTSDKKMFIQRLYVAEEMLLAFHISFSLAMPVVASPMFALLPS